MSPGFALEQMRLKTSTAVRSRSCAGDEQEEVAIEATDIHQGSAARRQVPTRRPRIKLSCEKEPSARREGLSEAGVSGGEDEAGL